MGYIENGKTVDAAIMGGIEKEGIRVQIVASGSYAEQFSNLNQYGLNIRVISPDLGKAKALKMLRAHILKVFLQCYWSRFFCPSTGFRPGALKCLESTECPTLGNHPFQESKTVPIMQRKSQEMEEVFKIHE